MLTTAVWHDLRISRPPTDLMAKLGQKMSAYARAYVVNSARLFAVFVSCYIAVKSSADATQNNRGKPLSSASKMAAVPPLAKKGLTHLLNSSSLLFHRRRQLRVDSDAARGLSVGYSASTVSLPESTTFSEPSAAASAEISNESQSDIDTNIVPVVCDDVTFLMVKDDFCRKPTDSAAVDKAEESSLLTCHDSGVLLQMLSSMPSSELTDKFDKERSDPGRLNADKESADTASLRSQQVTSVCLSVTVNI